MSITETTLGDITVFRLRGDLVLGAAAPTLADTVRRLAAHGRCYVLIDLSDVRYADSWGVGELVQCLTAVIHSGGGLRLVGVTRRLESLLVLTKLLTAFDCVDTIEDGLWSFVPALTTSARPTVDPPLSPSSSVRRH